MRIKNLISILFALILIDSSFSETCYRQESYCAEYGTIEYNCRVSRYDSYPCRVYGSHQVYVPKTCYEKKCSIQSVCGWGWRYMCDTRTVYDTCYNTCSTHVYKYCCIGSYVDPICGRQSACGVSYYNYYQCNPYNCNPHPEEYNCGYKNVYTCENTNVCTETPYDCSYYETRTEWYDSTCYNPVTVCDKATDYDKCLNWQDHDVAYDCTEMKLDSYSISSTKGIINEPMLATFQLSECTGTITYELYMKSSKTGGVAQCGLNNIELSPIITGTQTVLLKISDDKTSITKTLGVTLITNPNWNIGSNNPFIPTGEEFAKATETGSYDSKIMEWINQGLGSEEILKNLMITFGAVGLAITTTQANRIKNYIENLKISSQTSDSKLIKMVGRILGYAGIGVLATGAILAFLGASVPMTLIAGIAGILGLSGSALEYLSHQYSLNFELKTEEDKRIYLANNTVEMTLDLAFLLIDAATFGQGSKLKITRELLEEAIEKITKESVEEFSELSIKELSEEALERALKEAEDELLERVVKDSFNPITNLLRQKLVRYVTEETLDSFTNALAKQSDEVIELITRLLTENPEYIKLLANPKFFYSIVNIVSEIPAKDLSKLTSALLSNSLDFFKKTGKIPHFKWVKSIQKVSPCEFISEGDNLVINLAKDKIDDLIKYSDFLVQHELKHYEYKFVKNIDYTQKLMQYFDEPTAREINNILIDAQIDAELAATNPAIKEQIIKYEKNFFKEEVGKYLNNDPLNFAKLFYESEIGIILDNNFKNALWYIQNNNQYNEWLNIINEMIKK